MVDRSPTYAFFLGEFAAEENAGFQRLARVPDSRVAARLAFFGGLDPDHKRAAADYCARWAQHSYAFVLGEAAMEYRSHPFHDDWVRSASGPTVGVRRSVPDLRAALQQFRLDARRGTVSAIPHQVLECAKAMRPVTATVLRRRIRLALEPLGCSRGPDALGVYRCRLRERDIEVHCDFGGRHAQLRYVVVDPDYAAVRPTMHFRFERALGFGGGDWDYVVEENLTASMQLLAELVAYCAALPERLLTFAERG